MAKFDNLLRAPTLLLICIIGITSAGAAEIRIESSRGATPGFVLEGEIKPGDFETFKSLVSSNEAATELYLASYGGNVGEAIKIGILVRLLNMSTVVPGKPLTNQELVAAARRHDLKDDRKDYMCASACFFIFVAGIHRRADGFGSAILGIHRPALSNDNLEKLGPDRAATVDSQARTTIEKYLRAMDVPAKYAEDMYTVPKGRILWIRNDEFKSDFEGFIPALRGFVKGRCAALAAEQKRKSSFDREPRNPLEENALVTRIGVRTDCDRTIQDELALRARAAVLWKMNSEIPQSMPGVIPQPFQK